MELQNKISLPREVATQPVAQKQKQASVESTKEQAEKKQPAAKKRKRYNNKQKQSTTVSIQITSKDVNLKWYNKLSNWFVSVYNKLVELFKK